MGWKAPPCPPENPSGNLYLRAPIASGEVQQALLSRRAYVQSQASPRFRPDRSGRRAVDAARPSRGVRAAGAAARQLRREVRVVEGVRLELPERPVGEAQQRVGSEGGGERRHRRRPLAPSRPRPKAAPNAHKPTGSGRDWTCLQKGASVS